MRARAYLNSCFLLGNAALFACLVAILIGHRNEITGSPFRKRVEDDAAKMGMNTCFARFPFAFFVTEESPKANRFTLFQYDPPMIFSADASAVLSTVNNDRNTENEHTTVMLHLGQEFSLIVDFSHSAVEGYHVHLMELIRDSNDENRAFFDINGDGTYDDRILRDKTRGESKQQVWFAGDWCDVDRTIGENHKILVDGREVKFDRQAGIWRAAADE